MHVLPTTMHVKLIPAGLTSSFCQLNPHASAMFGSCSTHVSHLGLVAVQVVGNSSAYVNAGEISPGVELGSPIVQVK
jgi:hypothetical protein